MRLLFEIDTKDYNISGRKLVRDAARSIIIRDGKIALVHSLKYDYYKFPGGGIEDGESRLDALVRETLEEAGLVVIPESIAEYGYVHRIQKSFQPGEFEIFEQGNYYYFVRVEENASSQDLDDYEAEESFTLEYVEPETAIAANRKPDHGPKDENMIEREAKVLEMLINEGYFHK